MPTDPEAVNAWTSGFGLVMAIAAALVVVTIAVIARRRLGTHNDLARLEAERAIEDMRQRCVCGEIATAPKPTLRRSRNDWIGQLFAAPPRYRRHVDPMDPPAFCSTHAHLADRELDRVITAIRARQAALTAEIAGEVANFEQEGLAKKISDSLTDEQKRVSKRGALRAVANSN